MKASAVYIHNIAMPTLPCWLEIRLNMHTFIEGDSPDKYSLDELSTQFLSHAGKSVIIAIIKHGIR